MTYHAVVKWFARHWARIRYAAGLPVYYHMPCPKHRRSYHRVHLPANGPLLTLCPTGPIRIDPASWHLTWQERLVRPGESFAVTIVEDDGTERSVVVDVPTDPQPTYYRRIDGQRTIYWDGHTASITT